MFGSSIFECVVTAMSAAPSEGCHCRWRGGSREARALAYVLFPAGGAGGVLLRGGARAAERP